MSFFVPCTSTFTANQADRTLLRYWKLEVDTDDDGDLDDITAYIENNSLTIIAPENGAASASVNLRRTLGCNAGDYANAECQISAKIDNSEYIVVFTGYVKPEGIQRSRDASMQDTFRLDMEDRTRKYTTRRKMDPAIIVNYTICSPSAPSESIFHYLASAMGLTAANVVCTEITYVKPYLPLKGGLSPWHEMKKMAEQFRAEMYFRYDGKLLFDSPYQAGWSEPASEITLDVSNIHRWTGRKREIVCNRVICEFEEYEALSGRPIYKHTENWQEDLQQCSVVIGAGEYWPGPTSNDTAILHYKDPKTGENYPIAASVQTPTLGGTTGGYDIESSGGTLTLSSFNASNDRTEQHPDASEIILKNNNGSSVTMTRLVIRGTPVVVRAEVKVKDEDATITNDWEFIEKIIPGDYAISAGLVHKTTQWWQEYGSTARYEYDIECDWLPQVQRGAVVRFDAPGVPSAIYAKVLDYRHTAANGPMGNQKTVMRLGEQVSGYTVSGTGIIKGTRSGISKPQRVVVGASSYTGIDAMFECYGSSVATVINNAIAYVYNTHGGGTVELSEGIFPIGARISGLTNVEVIGRGANTIIRKNCNDYGIKIAGTAGSEVTGAALRNFKVTRLSTDTNVKSLVYAEYMDDSWIEGLIVEDSYDKGIELNYCDDILVNAGTVRAAAAEGVYMKACNKTILAGAFLISCLIGCKMITDEATNMIDRGGCESETEPMIENETSALTSNLTAARDATTAYTGSYSYKFTPTSTTLSGYYWFTENKDTTDMHGTTAGKGYRFSAWYFVPSSYEPQSAYIRVFWYASGAWSEAFELDLNPAGVTPDTWINIQATAEAPSGATGFYLELEVQSNIAGKYLFLDEIYLYEYATIKNGYIARGNTVRQCTQHGFYIATDEADLVDNLIENCLSTGINVKAGWRNNILANKSIYNGADEIENENGDNFNDEGTETRVGQNSWQGVQA